MMRHFQQLRFRMLFYNPPLFRAFGIRLEQSGCTGHTDSEYQRLQIWLASGPRLIAARSEHMKMSAAIIKFISLCANRNFHAGALRLCQDRIQFRIRGIRT